MAFNFSQSNKALPLKTRMGIRDNTESFEASLAAIRTATGIDFAFEVHGDVVAFNKAIDEPYEDRLGEIFFGSSSGVLPSLATCVTNGCTDALVQEDLQDACSAKLLVFRVKLEGWPGGLYHPLSIENGVLFADFYTDTVWTSVDEVGSTKLEDIPRISVLDMLPVALEPVAFKPTTASTVSYKVVQPSIAAQSMACTQPVAMATVAMTPVDQNGLVVGRWKVGICDCLVDLVPNACMAYWCPCVSLAKTVHRIGLYTYTKTLVIYGVFYFVETLAYPITLSTHDECILTGNPAICKSYKAWMAVLLISSAATMLMLGAIRLNVRRAFQIPGSQCDDYWCVSFCSCCVIAQMASHTDSYTKGPCCSCGPKDTLPGYFTARAETNAIA